MLTHLRKVNEEQQRLSEGLLSVTPSTHAHAYTPKERLNLGLLN